MSRAGKKLAELKAKEEFKKLKADKKQKQQQQLAATPKGVKITAVIIVAIIILFIIIGISSSSTQSNNEVSESTKTTQETKKEEPKAKTDKEIMTEDIAGLIDAKEAFDIGSYVKGDIPVGEYAYVPLDSNGKYYSEEDSAGNIIDNENFDSFGYVYVQGAGNLQTQGVLIKSSAFKKLGVSGAKEIYEKLNNIPDYKESAMYKVGVDVSPGTYTLKSYGEGYVEVMSGPVGNSDIVDNEIFNGKYSVTVSVGQYLKVSTAKIL